jgi:hypothetical protein
MAVVHSNAVGKATKSAGVNTYRTVRGRCIMSQRIYTNKSNTHAQRAQRGGFGVVSSCIKTIADWVNMSFSLTKYGSSRNNFLKTNKVLIDVSKNFNNNQFGGITNLEALSTLLIECQNAGQTVLAGAGSIAVNWNGVVYTDNNYVDISTSRRYVEGDTVNIMVASVIDMPSMLGMRVDLVNLISYTLTADDVIALKNPFTFRVDNTVIPNFGTRASLLPPDANLYSTIMSANVVGVDKILSNTYFTTDYKVVRHVRMESTANYDAKGTFDMIFVNTPSSEQLITDKPVGATYEIGRGKYTFTAFNKSASDVLTGSVLCDHGFGGSYYEEAEATEIYLDGVLIYVIENPPGFDLDS